MGKLSEQLPVHQQQIDRDGVADSRICCGGCSIGVSKMCKVFNFRCVVVLILSVSVILSAIRCGWPHHSGNSGFDAKSAIKNSATVQASFRLQKPVSVLVPLINKLEYDINEEIGVPFTKVVILSIHSAPVHNLTDVVFGLLSDNVNAPINAVYLSLLKSSLVGLFLEQFNLTLTNSTFGQPSLFEIVKCPGGITVIPENSASPWQIPQIFFNFTLHNSIDEIRQNFAELKQQLTSGLDLTPDEDMYVQVTNEIGSTTNRPVTVQISVTSDQGGILPQRMKQLAQTITGSSSKNLGLDHSVFGKVKQISLSSYLRNTLVASAPTPSPAPSPGEDDYAEPSYAPDISPSYSSAPTPQYHHQPPCFDCDASPPCDGNSPISPSPVYYSSTPISYSPAPSIVYTPTPHPSPHCGSVFSPSPLAPSQSYAPPPNPLVAPSQSYLPPLNPLAASSQYNPLPPTVSPHSSTPTWTPTSRVSPGLSPLPAVAYSSSPSKEKGNGKSSQSLTSSTHVTTPSMRTWMFVIVILSTFHHLRCV